MDDLRPRTRRPGALVQPAKVHVGRINIDPELGRGTAPDIVLLIEDQTEAVVNLIQNSIDNERLASVGRLAAGVAHEIGNPVTGIACLAQNLEHETEARPDRRICTAYSGPDRTHQSYCAVPH